MFQMQFSWYNSASICMSNVISVLNGLKTHANCSFQCSLIQSLITFCLILDTILFHLQEDIQNLPTLITKSKISLRGPSVSSPTRPSQSNFAFWKGPIRIETSGSGFRFESKVIKSVSTICSIWVDISHAFTRWLSRCAAWYQVYVYETADCH